MQSGQVIARARQSGFIRGMKQHRGWGFRGALLAAASGIFASAGMAQAQSAAGTPAPGADLRQQLSDLAANPQSVNELVATGRAALAMGDAQGALGFFTRAQELSANDARVKAGMAAANVRIGRPETALTLFAEAVAAGAPVNDLLGDRGLAYDMIGQTARAQQDYHASLRHRDDAEVRRRLALSLAISGQREAALRLIEPQIRSGDRAGQRARIMVLALSGDERGASGAAAAALNPQQASALSPFLTRMASLAPGDMAAAANLGRVPAAGAARLATARAEADPAALAFAGGGASALPARLPVAVADASTPRRRPGGVTSNASAPGATAADRNAAARNAGRPQGNWTNASSTMRLPAAAPAASAAVTSNILQPHPHEPLRINEAGLEQPALAGVTRSEPRVSAARIADAEVAPPVVSAPARRVQLASAAQPEPDRTNDAQPEVEDEPVDGAAANLAVWNSGAAPAAPARVQAATPPPARATPVRTEPVRAAPVQNVVRRETSAPAASGPAFSDVVASVSALPVEAPAATPAATAAPRQTAPARTTPARSRAATPAATTPAATTPARATNAATRTGSAATRTGTATTRAANPRTAHPARIWVQLGVSNNRAGFNYEMTRMRRLAPELARQTAHTAPVGSSHRLLVGPFPTDAAARTFINTLRGKDIQSMAWTSSAGTEVERLPAGR